ncbi:2049_t:CDS:10 [Funneliformis geosporum]|uniref:16184_t:CDS:1 n=1 Tax=Funneliformis geosporum TaxID=1117311 RepID=A0A9W4SNQ7_9GLOM|nr:16184_t:CDS:10 [Funneliformis geosporum]CAI2182105.1 2049_t:CDS:10 [Funneliformis geosporum]
MASHVVILIPGGKRQTVKTTPAMPLKQIVKLVCDKQGYSDVDKYGLKQNKTILDLSLSIRFSNLAPGAKLELIRVTTPKVHSEVTIALQMDDGGRIIGKFPPTTSFWDILLHFENTSQDRSLNLTKRTAQAPQIKKTLWKKMGGKSNDKFVYQQPVCLLLNQEYGTIPLLKSTTLQSAGITSGNAALRILFRHTELSLDDVLEEINTPIQSSTSTNPDKENKSGTLVQSTIPPISSTSKVEQIETTDLMKSAEGLVDPAKTVEGTVESTKPAKEIVDPTKPVEGMEDLTKPVEGTVDLAKPVEGTVDLMEQVEETIDPTKQVEKINPMQSVEETIDPMETEETIVPMEQIEETMKPSEETIYPMENINATIDSQIEETVPPILSTSKMEPIDMQIETGTTKTEIEPSSIILSNSETNTNGSVKGQFSRDVKVFNPPPDNVTLSTQIDLPDSFYELTPSELQFLLANQSSKRKAEENVGFKTHSIREQEEKSRERKYPKTLIRVRFPDSFQIQMAFLSKETVGQLYEFVRDALRTPQREFYLYTSPPKNVLLDMSVSLYHAELTPASVIYFSWTEKISDSEHILSDEYLKLREDIPHLTTNSTNVPEKSEQFNDKGAHVLSEPSRQQNQEELVRGQRSHARGESSSSQNSKKIPKWLTFGKKK